MKKHRKYGLKEKNQNEEALKIWPGKVKECDQGQGKKYDQENKKNMTKER